jgi:hypothetical protein
MSCLDLDWIFFNLFTCNNGCDMKCLQVVIPAGNVLVEHLTLRVQMGSNLLITGGNPLSPNDFHLTSAELTVINSATAS